MVTTESGLQYKDIKVGDGPSPPVGFQVCKLFQFLKLNLFSNVEIKQCFVIKKNLSSVQCKQFNLIFYSILFSCSKNSLLLQLLALPLPLHAQKIIL